MRDRRRAIAWVAVLVAFAALGVGAGLGFWYARHAGAAGSGQISAPGTDKQLYTCGMHPQVIQEGPGNCPICGMTLTPMKAGGDSGAGESTERRVFYWRSSMNPNEVSDRPGKDAMGMDLVPVYAPEGETPSGHTVQIDPVTVQNMGIRTAVLQRGPLARTIRTVGRVTYNEELVTFVNTKFDGWIEKLHVNQTGQFVKKGAPLFEVYSPQLYLAQEEYLAALRSREAAGAGQGSGAGHAERMVDTARTKLRFFDISDEQIEQLGRTGSVQKTLTIHSPAEGIVTEKDVLAGQFVQAGMKLYTVADLSRVWVYVSVYEYQLPWVRVGQSATMTLPYVPAREFAGKVVYVYPFLEEQTRVIRVRLEFENPTLELKPDMYATVTLRSELDRDAVLIPREAYIDSGLRKVAFVERGEGKFEPREIQVGVEAEEGMVEVLYGLDAGERVVTSGQFLLDSESKLQEAVAKMRGAQASASPASPEDASSAAGNEQTAHTH